MSQVIVHGLAVGLAATMAGVLPTQDWRAFRGNDASATSEESVPRKFGAEINLVWKTELPGPGSSSPIVVGDKVFITCWTGHGVDRDQPGDLEDLRRHLLCIARDKGNVVWTRTVGPVATEDAFGGRMATHGYASSTPVSDGENVYVFFGKSGVFGFDLEGEELWRADVGSGSSKWTTGSGSSPTLWRDRLIVNASDESQAVYALDKRTGEELWRRSSESLDQAYGTPLVRDGEVLLALLGAIWCLDADTGEPHWTVDTITNGALAPTVIAGDNMLFSFGGQTRKRCYAIDLEATDDGSRIAWSSRYGSYVCTPLYFDGHLYWATEGGIAHCADAKTGELAFQQRLEGVFYASMVRAGDVIYAVSRDSGTYVLAAKPEFEVLELNVFANDDSEFDGTPAVSGGQLFLRSDRYLYCVGDE